jgi:naphthalene 1,2-dioxygenase system ferredoxin subunit
MSGNWFFALERDCVADGDIVAVELANKKIAIYGFVGAIYATDNVCTHGDALLSDGFLLEDGAIECPLHQGQFDIKTGKALCRPLEHNVQSYAIKIEDGKILVAIDPS